MRSFSTVFLFAAVGMLGVRACDSEFSCSPPLSVRQLTAPLPLQNRQVTTNAERLARGMPLLPPVARHNDKDKDKDDDKDDKDHKKPHPSKRPKPSHSKKHTPSSTPVPKTTYHGVIQVSDSSHTVLGFVATDPNYWTPLLTQDINSAQVVEFQLNSGATSGSQLPLTQIGQTYPLLGLVVGRDSTSSNISPGSFNYFYVDPIALPGPPSGSTPQSVPSFFSVSTGLDKQAESNVWAIDIPTGAMTVQWINTDSTKPTTFVFVQSNHLYAGGDPAAFNSRFPAPVLVVNLRFIPTV